MHGPDRRANRAVLVAPRQRPRQIRGAVIVALAGALAAGCGPEMFHQGIEQNLPGTGGAGGDLADAGDDGAGGADSGDTGPSCVNGNGGVSGDAALPVFTSSWTFDGPAGQVGWAPIGQPPEVVAATTTTLDDRDGFPCAGSARLTIPFTVGSSQVAYGYSFPNGPQNFSGKVLTAHVRLNSPNPSGTIMVGLAFKSIASVYLFASSAVLTIVSASGWVTLSLSFDHPDGFVDMSRTSPDGGIITPDPAAVLEIDVLILTGNAPFTTTDVSIDTVGMSDG